MVRDISNTDASARYCRLSRINTNTRIGKTTTTSQAPSPNFAIAKMATTLVDKIPADRLITSLYRQPGPRQVKWCLVMP